LPKNKKHYQQDYGVTLFENRELDHDPCNQTDYQVDQRKVAPPGQPVG